MNKKFHTGMAAIILSMSAISCGHKDADASAEIKQAVKDMAQASSSTSDTVGKTPSQQLDEALTAYKSGNYQEAVTQLLTIRTHAQMTGAQLLALNNAIGAVMNDLYTRMAKGDTQAQVAIKEYERLQNHPR